MRCDNCGELLNAHCHVHLIPCCPGKCPGRSAKGIPTTEHHMVGGTFQILGRGPYQRGVCISVTYWGSGRVRWARLRHRDGTERSYAPSQLIRREP
jgi:hypothetical protein